jgi:prepilin-type N-terminal cleavage/methylation domain-containing protein
MSDARVRRAEGGFSLIEVLVAALILGLALLALAQLFASGVKSNTVAKEDTVMATFAQDKLEAIKRLSKAQLEGLFSSSPDCRGTCVNCVCGSPGCGTPCCAHACYPAACTGSGAVKVHTDWEDPIPDPNSQDDVKEALYVRYWRIERVTLGSPVGCMYKFTVIVGSRNPTLSKAPSSAVSWLSAAKEEVVSVGTPYETNPRPRRVMVATYAIR